MSVDLERRVELLEETVKLLMDRHDGLQESLKTLALENRAIRTQLKARDFGRTLMGHLERQ